MVSMGEKFEHERAERAAKVAETLKMIMKEEDVSAQTCCEGWDEAIKLLRGAIRRLNLLPPNVRIEHLTVKDMTNLLEDAARAALQKR